MESLFNRQDFKKRRQAALPRRAAIAPLILEELKPLFEGPTLSFSSLPEEIDMIFVNEYLLRKGWLVLPRMSGDRLALHLVRSPLEQNGYGIWEPSAEDPEVVPRLGLIPGLAFDERGGRVGYGGGYYDRLLSDLDIRAIGIGYEEQYFAELPQRDHDIALDEVRLF